MRSVFALPYDQIKAGLDKQIIEPAWGWGFRVAIAVFLPSFLSIYTGNLDFFWMIIAAETVSVMELKGSTILRLRLLLSAVALSLLFTFVGSIVGNYPYLALILLMPIALCAGLMKNLGDWGLALALNVYLFYIISINFPLDTAAALANRMYMVGAGGIWALLVGVFSYSFLPQGKPYRRTIAHIWLAVENLAALVANNWDVKSKRSSIRAIYLKEKGIRTAIDESVKHFKTGEGRQPVDKQLDYARRCTSLASVQVISIAEQSDKLAREYLNPLFKAQMYGLIKLVEQIANRVGYYTYTMKEEELLLIQTRIKRLEQFEQQLLSMPEGELKSTQELVLHLRRFSKWVQLFIDTITQNQERRVYRQYSMMQTLNILHPRHLALNLRQFLNFDNLTMRYALRKSIAATFSYWLGIQFFPEHAYWLPMTSIIVSQPFFGATLRRGIERSIGTVVGVIVGGLALTLPHPEIVRYILIFFGAVLMIYFMRKNYAIAAFFISLFLIGLLAHEDSISQHLIIERIYATLIGAACSIVAGFVLFPAWDEHLLPNYLTKAIASNYKYFSYLFYEQEEPQKWMQYKAAAESCNSNAYDSLSRYLIEPKSRKKAQAASYFTAITYNIRITRELNFYQDDSEAGDIHNQGGLSSRDSIIPLLTKINHQFQKTIQLLEKRYQLDMKIDWNAEKYIREHLVPTEHQWQCLERLYLELKALHAGLER